jgi:hypothetical protein
VIKHFLRYWLSAFVLAFAAACPPALKSRSLTFMPQLYFATVSGQAIGGAQADINVILPFPCRYFQVVSMLAVQNSVFFHFVPLNKVYGVAAIVPTGRENWIPLSNQPVNTAPPYYWTRLDAGAPIKNFYLDMGTENGAANTITIMCVPDTAEVTRADGGPWGS